ncbi:hypothetical protein [Micromonospora sp. WMMD737]|uniref:hypothetical protein n=1 Tax=Micromonospora sp. WMMD737 TaxID=3404113 RepID=UPI003B94780B
MADRPVGAVIEIVERRTHPIAPATVAADVICPNEIRINGQKLLAPRDHPVKVHEMDIRADSLVLVTLTLFAKRITVCAEEPEEVNPNV